jgi:hypothetical protein
LDGNISQLPVCKTEGIAVMRKGVGGDRDREGERERERVRTGVVKLQLCGPWSPLPFPSTHLLPCSEYSLFPAISVLHGVRSLQFVFLQDALFQYFMEDRKSFFPARYSDSCQFLMSVLSLNCS